MCKSEEDQFSVFVDSTSVKLLLVSEKRMRARIIDTMQISPREGAKETERRSGGSQGDSDST